MNNIPSLRCTELNNLPDTALLLTQALSDITFLDSASDSNSATASPSSDRSWRRTKGSADESTTNTPPLHCGSCAEEGEKECQALSPQIPYTTVAEFFDASKMTEWNLADGFPFPCPVVRDPTHSGAVYVPGEVLRLQLRPPPRQHNQPPPPSPMPPRQQSVRVKEEDGEKTISLQEVIRQVPIRLSHYRDGDLDGYLYDAWLYGDPQEPLRDRFARMDRSLRSKFIGLKNSSARVRDKVRQKKITTYKEVAEELVEEIGLMDAPDKKSALEAENLKRRVYDVLNVFEAVGLITKDQKNVYWKGSSTQHDREVQELEEHAARLRNELKRRKWYLKQIEENYHALGALRERNREVRDEDPDDVKLPLPFFLIHAPETTPVDVVVSDDGKQAKFDFHETEFSMSGDMWALRQMGLHRAQPSPLSASSMQHFHAFPRAEGHEHVITPKSTPVPGLSESLHESSGDLGERVYPFIPQSLENGVDTEDTNETEFLAENHTPVSSREINSRKRNWDFAMGESEDTTTTDTHSSVRL